MKEPGLLNLGSYEVNWEDDFGILEDRVWPTDEKLLLKIFGNSVGSFNSLLLLWRFGAKIAFCFFFCRFVSSDLYFAMFFFGISDMLLKVFVEMHFFP